MEPFHIICDWVGTSDMAVSQNIALNYANVRIPLKTPPYPGRIRGKLASVETIPGASGDKATYCPAGTYALTLLDPYSYDVLDGNGAGRSITAAEEVVFDTPVPIDFDPTFTIASTATTDQIAGRGAFAGAATGWTLGAGWAYGTNNIVKTAGTGTASDATFAAIATRVYEVTFTISSWSAAANRSLTCSVGATDGTAVSADGTYTQVITATNTNGLIFTPTGTDATNVGCILDTVTIKYSTPAGRTILHFI
jgi:hypothetical protein